VTKHLKLALTTDLDLAITTAYIPVSSLKPFTFNIITIWLFLDVLLDHHLYNQLNKKQNYP